MFAFFVLLTGAMLVAFGLGAFAGNKESKSGIKLYVSMMAIGIAVVGVSCFVSVLSARYASVVLLLGIFTIAFGYFEGYRWYKKFRR